MPHGQLNAAVLILTVHIERKAMIEKWAVRVAMDGGPLEADAFVGRYFGQNGHFDVGIDGATVRASQITASNNYCGHTKKNRKKNEN